MKKLLCLLLALVFVLSLAACGEKTEETPTEQETTEGTETTEMTTPPAQVIVPLDSFYMDYKEADWTEAYYIQAYPNGDGTAYVEYKTELGRKMSNMDMSIMEQLAAAYEGSELLSLNGQEIYEDGEAVGSVYITRGDEACSYTYYGAEVPTEYKDIFSDMSTIISNLMKDIPEYVVQPQVGEGVDETHLGELTAILEGSGIQALDSLAINAIASDEYFGFNAGLSGAEGIDSCTGCTALMMTVPYSLTVVTVSEGTDLNAIADDFAKSIDWGKWVCVQPSNATIAVKDNMVLCLLGQDEMYFGTAGAIEENGWTVVETLKNTNM